MTTIIEFRDGKKDYAGTAKYDGTLEGRLKFEEETPGRHKLKTRYVYAVKHDSQGLVTKFKARLVVLGYGQIWGLEYNPLKRPSSCSITGGRASNVSAFM